MKRGYALCVGLTPAVQDTRVVGRLQLGEVNRCRSVAVSAAGKGLNVARMVQQLGGTAVVVGFAGTTATPLFGLHSWERFIPVRARNRVCVTVREEATGRVTELVEEAQCPRPSEWRALFRLLDELADGAQQLAISGALMPGAPPDMYARIVQRVGQKTVLIDSQGEPLRRVLPLMPLLVKLNRLELINTVGPLPLERAARKLCALGARHVLVTEGARGAWLIAPGGSWRFEIPRVRALNPIGSGDAVTAGILVGLQREQSLPEAVRLGMACGVANTLTPLAGYLRRADVREILPRVRCRPA
ncbi:MAG: PfkB family carbohydrate kinase [Verrucomicrobiae bacterium]|nr:PfkB family carbohydrate kinase [Verrucomicrobiae bacterium]